MTDARDEVKDVKIAKDLKLPWRFYLRPRLMRIPFLCPSMELHEATLIVWGRLKLWKRDRVVLPQSGVFALMTSVMPINAPLRSDLETNPGIQ